ncbi:hypothetical protein MRX96_017941 [Rhipicephalus microplus]|uniref:Receptor expression-enhancing protein n=1 Tax=Rhipicephalus microplus TaxID=6941 RepID=A0A9J6DX77_RHIMP|nr:receptor expression-enhancing protein 5-like [Rhipicephalus microplus]KAH8026522.1 hypothetical protein HPB51_021134 [Rhipicephalus microplus]
MFSRANTNADTDAASEESSRSAAEAEPDPDEAPTETRTPEMNLVFQAVKRFHGFLKSQLYADTILGRSTAELEVVSNVRRDFMLYVFLLLLVLSFLVGVFGRHMSNVICVPYPAAISLIAVDSNVNKRYVKWITYWMLFGFVNLADMTCPLVSRLVPQYHLWRTVFLVWCFCPYKWNGCKLVRERLYTAKNMRIMRVVAYVFYEGTRMLTAE